MVHTCGIHLHHHHHVLVKYFDITFRFAKPLLQKNVEILKSVLIRVSDQGYVTRIQWCSHEHAII